MCLCMQQPLQPLRSAFPCTDYIVHHPCMYVLLYVGVCMFYCCSVLIRYVRTCTAQLISCQTVVAAFIHRLPREHARVQVLPQAIQEASAVVVTSVTTPSPVRHPDTTASHATLLRAMTLQRAREAAGGPQRSYQEVPAAPPALYIISYIATANSGCYYNL